jgi:DNA mismatch repair protein MutS
MMQIGSFVPASTANIGVVDKIFTRVGASDDLAVGQSTFMVEMMEVSEIIRNATANSLVVLDEIGRGTSTYDGLSIAWAILEYIESKCKCKTLFATHYHELTSIEERSTSIKNYSVQVKEKGEDVIFLRKIAKGKIDDSYGVQVAKLAGIPNSVIVRANQILKSLEKKDTNLNLEKLNKAHVEGQITLGDYRFNEVSHILDKINLDEMTGIEALSTLAKLKESLK